MDIWTGQSGNPIGSTVRSSSDDESAECGNKIYGLNKAYKECSEILVEDHTRKEGLSTHPSLRCEQCGAMNNIPISTLPHSHKVLTINRKSVSANKCIGSTSSSLNTFCMMMDLPAPVSQKQYREHAQVINDQCIAEAQESMN